MSYHASEDGTWLTFITAELLYLVHGIDPGTAFALYPSL